jgi:hypothetical protein
VIRIAIGLLLAVLAVGSSAHAQGSPFAAVLPPAEFDHQFRGTLTVKRLPDGEALAAACRTKERFACTFPKGASCVIYMRSDADIRDARWSPQIVLRHEIGHCNGWGKDHAGARRIPPLEIEKYY